MKHWTLNVDNQRRIIRESKRRQRASLPRCAVKECEIVAHWPNGSKLYCHRHWLLQVEHDKIVARIRAIPIRER